MNLQNIADVVLPIQRPYPRKIYIFVYVQEAIENRSKFDSCHKNEMSLWHAQSHHCSSTNKFLEVFLLSPFF